MIPGTRSHSILGVRGFLIGLSSIFWRESWKYGERAFRYCNHDVGHALAAVSIAANLFGWKVTYLNGLSDNTLDTVLGFDKTRFESLEERASGSSVFHPPLRSIRNSPYITAIHHFRFCENHL